MDEYRQMIDHGHQGFKVDTASGELEALPSTADHTEEKKEETFEQLRRRSFDLAEERSRLEKVSEPKLETCMICMEDDVEEKNKFFSQIYFVKNSKFSLAFQIQKFRFRLSWWRRSVVLGMVYAQVAFLA